MAETGRPIKSSLAFWFSVLWILITAACAFGAELLPLLPYDHIGWNHPSAAPGTKIEISGRGDSGPAGHAVYLLGADTMGRDILSRLIHGARVSLAIGLTVPATGLLIGGLLGLVAGYFRGWPGTLIMVIMDGLLAFPALVFLLAVTFYLGPSLQNLILALGMLSLPVFARVARANTLKAVQNEYVLAAKISGLSDLRIMFCEIPPNIIIPLCSYGLTTVAYLIMAEGTLSFLGLGVPAPIPSWGGMIAEGREVLDISPHITLLPALMMFLTVLSFNFAGDHLRRWAEPREQQL